MKKTGGIMKVIFFLGRVLFSAIFIVKGLEHFCEKMVSHAASMGVPMPMILVPLAGVIALLGGLSVLLGYKAKVGAWLLVIFLLPTTFFMHPFWQSANDFSAMMQHYCFWKNLSLLGTALMLSYFGSGPLSLDKKS
jgi:putative oxidoreductase